MAGMAPGRRAGGTDRRNASRTNMGTELTNNNRVMISHGQNLRKIRILLQQKLTVVSGISGQILGSSNVYLRRRNVLHGETVIASTLL